MPKTVRHEAVGVRKARIAQAAENTETALQCTNTAGNHGRGISPKQAEIPAPLPTERFDGNGIELADNLRMGQAILQYRLPIADGRDVVLPCARTRGRHDIINVAIIGGGGLEQDIQLDVLGKLHGSAALRRWGRIEIPVGIHQERLHGRTLVRSCSYVTPRFSASDRA